MYVDFLSVIQIKVRGTVYIHLKGVGNSSEITSKMSFLRYSTGESVMIVESFWHRPLGWDLLFQWILSGIVFVRISQKLRFSVKYFVILRYSVQLNI